MIFLPLAILFLAVCCGIFGYRHDEAMFKNLAGIFLLAAVGSAMILFFALSVK